MKVVVAIDSFKGSLPSLEAGFSVKEGIKKAVPEAEVTVRPVADGGEGTVDALTEGMGGKKETITVTGPLGQPVTASYGIIKESGTAIMEMSAAAGITLVDASHRNPLYTTTYGVGEMIADAIGKGCRNFIIGIGGSSTNDAGTGMLQALGFGFYDKNGNQVNRGAIGLKDIVDISTENVLPELEKCLFKIACDVTNPLCGENGCSAVYGPQKGADSEMIKLMDEWLVNFAMLAKEKYSNSDMNTPGAGAAGGLGYAFSTFTNAILKPGIEIVLEETKIEEYIKDADIVVTGEGRLDSQTVMGKAPIGVAKLGKKHGCKVIAFAGCVSDDASVCNEHGIDAFFPVLRKIETLEQAMKTENASQNLTATAEQVFRLLNS